ncbi:MAG: arsenite methyltransferase [Deltaproteobacteria bacterium]|nr:arsenite methyltransferase [Deltaproteobacteria bacterium]
MERSNLKEIVKTAYGKIAKEASSCCGQHSGCCGNPDFQKEIYRKTGYSEEDLAQVPQEANLGLGCGNPSLYAGLREGEKVLDIGSGAGFDCFLASKMVGRTGKVIGVDITKEMVNKAKAIAKKEGYDNVEFIVGDMESLPISENSIDVVISNCAINLSTDKGRVFAEVYRILKPGGRIAISDIVLSKELPDSVKNSIDAYISCVSGALMREEYLRILKDSGFCDVKIIEESFFSQGEFTPDSVSSLRSISVLAFKPKEG